MSRNIKDDVTNKIDVRFVWIREYSKPKGVGMREINNNLDEINRLKKELFRVTQEREL